MKKIFFLLCLLALCIMEARSQDTWHIVLVAVTNDKTVSISEGAKILRRYVEMQDSTLKNDFPKDRICLHILEGDNVTMQGITQLLKNLMQQPRPQNGKQILLFWWFIHGYNNGKELFPQLILHPTAVEAAQISRMSSIDSRQTFDQLVNAKSGNQKIYDHVIMLVEACNDKVIPIKLPDSGQSKGNGGSTKFRKMVFSAPNWLCASAAPGQKSSVNTQTGGAFTNAVIATFSIITGGNDSSATIENARRKLYGKVDFFSGGTQTLIQIPTPTP